MSTVETERGEAATLQQELVAVLNRHSAENGSNTPDFILAQFLLGCLAAFDGATLRRGDWYEPKEESA